MHYSVFASVKFILIFTFFLSAYSCAFAAAPDSLKNQSPIITEITLSSRMIWRGIDFASSPSLQGLFAYRNKGFEAGTFGCVTFNGNKVGYGNTLEAYASFTKGNLTFVVDDYFFFNDRDSLNNYFEWQGKKTQHYIEGRIKYAVNEMFSLTGAYVVHHSSFDNTNGLYFEAEYSPTKYFSILAGGLTGASGLNFQQSGGVTNIGITGKRNIEVTQDFSMLAKVSVIISPNYKSIVDLPGVGKNPIYFVLSLTF
jgi:hypothetical protein